MPLSKRSTSIWSLREFQLVHGVSEACRGAGFLCQLGQANFRRPVGVLTNIASLFDQLYKGWPCLVHDKEDLQYRGPLPNHCLFVPQNHNLKGVDAADHFTSASSHTLGERFWSCFFVLEKIGTVQPSSLGDGDVDSTIAAFSSSPCLSPRSAPSLTKGSGSLSLFYGSWKNTVSRVSKAVDVSSPDGISAYFSSPKPSSLTSSTRSLLASIWLRSSTMTTPFSSFAYSPPVPSTLTGHSSRTTRSRSPRSVQDPLTSRSRQDGGLALLTGAVRRSLSARSEYSIFPVIQHLM